MKHFRHTDAHALSEAMELLVKHGKAARLLAGGTDLLGLLKTDVLPVYPELLINIKTIPEMDCVRCDDGGLGIGPLARLADIAGSQDINSKYPVLASAAASVGMPQIRAMGTIGGNLAQETRCWYYRYPHEIGGRINCRRKGEGPCPAVNGDNRYHALFGGKHCFAVCPSDTAVALAALDAQLKIVGPVGERLLDVADFYHPLGNALGAGEIIAEIRIPRAPSGGRQTFIKYRVREAIDFAIVSVAAVVEITGGICSSARIFLGAVACGPYRAVEAEKLLAGKAMDSETIAAAAEAAVSGARPLGKNGYKVEIARILVKRALSEIGANPE